MRWNLAISGTALWLGLMLCGSPATAASAQAWDHPGAAEAASATLVEVAQWVVASGDNRGLPFAIVDKIEAQVFVFDAEGQLRGFAPALLGLAHGDGSTPGIGDRPLSKIAPEERTTPAGRFLASYGPAAGGKTVLWVDYATAVSLHTVVTANRQERRLQRLDSATPDDNRITYGCINVSAAFYEDVVRPTFTGAGGVFYVLPEIAELAEVLPAFKPPSAAVRAEPGGSISDGDLAAP